MEKLRLTQIVRGRPKDLEYRGQLGRVGVSSEGNTLTDGNNLRYVNNG